MSSGDLEGDLIVQDRNFRVVTRFRVDHGHDGVSMRVRRGDDEATWTDMTPGEARELAGRLMSAACWAETLA